MNDEFYKMLTLNRIRGFANKEEPSLSEDDLATIIVWLHELSMEVGELQTRFRSMWWERQ